MKSIRLFAITSVSLVMLATASCCSTCVERADGHKAAKADCRKCCGEKKTDCCSEKKAEANPCCGCSKKA